MGDLVKMKLAFIFLFFALFQVYATEMPLVTEEWLPVEQQSDNLVFAEQDEVMDGLPVEDSLPEGEEIVMAEDDVETDEEPGTILTALTTEEISSSSLSVINNTVLTEEEMATVIDHEEFESSSDDNELPETPEEE